MCRFVLPVSYLCLGLLCFLGISLSCCLFDYLDVALFTFVAFALHSYLLSFSTDLSGSVSLLTIFLSLRIYLTIFVYPILHISIFLPQETSRLEDPPVGNFVRRLVISILCFPPDPCCCQRTKDEGMGRILNVDSRGSWRRMCIERNPVVNGEHQ